MMSLPPHHWVSEGSWDRCTPAVFCEQVQKRRQVRAISSLSCSHLLSFSSIRQTQLTHLWKLLNFFGPTPVMMCCRLAVAHSINCSGVTWKLRAVSPFPAGISELSTGSYLLAPTPLSMYLDSVMPTHKLGSCLTRAEMPEMGFSSLHITTKIVVFSSGKKSSVSSLYPVSSFTVVPMPCSNNKKHLGKCKLERERGFSLWTAKVVKLLLVPQI